MTPTFFLPFGNKAGTSGWKRHGRRVLAGEKAFYVWAPVRRRPAEDEAARWEAEGRTVVRDDHGRPVIQVVGFRLSPTFDVSQTDGEPFEPPTVQRVRRVQATGGQAPQLLDGDDPTGVYDDIVELIKGEGFAFDLAAPGSPLLGRANGVTVTGPGIRHVLVRDDVAAAQRTKTTMHELAHIRCGHTTGVPEGEDLHRGRKETEAESVAHVCCRALGLDTQVYSDAYVLGWANGDMDLIRECAETVLRVAKAILDDLTPAEAPEPEQPGAEDAVTSPVSGERSGTHGGAGRGRRRPAGHEPGGRAAVTRPPEPGQRGGVSPNVPVTDDLLIDALQGLQPWRSVGDSVDWEIALFAYDVPTDVRVQGVPIPAGLYVREVTGDGRHVIAQRWTDRAALIEHLNTVEHRHFLFEHITHADPRFVAAHTDAIHAHAVRVFALIEADERAGGPLHDATIRCWHDLSRHIGHCSYLQGLPWPGEIASYLEDEFVTAVVDRTDTLLHQRDRLLSFDEAEAAGLDGTGRDGRDPRTWASLTPRQRSAAGLNPDSTTTQTRPHAS